MMPINSITISSRANPWVAQWQRWQSKSSERKLSNKVWLEGEHLVKEALMRCAAAPSIGPSRLNPYSLCEIIVPDTPQGHQMLASLCQSAGAATMLPTLRVVFLNAKIYAQLCSVNSSPAACCVVELAHEAQVDFAQSSVVLDSVQDPGNVGTVVRLCAAFGVRQVLLSQGCASAWGPKAVRAGQGAQLAVRLFEDVDLTQSYVAFQAKQTPIVATSLEPGSVPLAQVQANRLGQPMAWVFGNEGQGIGAITQSFATVKVHIPMRGGFESLNVASAAAICLWQASQWAA